MKNKPRTGRPLSPRPPFPSVAQFVEERALTHEHSPFRSANGDYLSKLRMNAPSRCGRARLVNSLLQLSDDAVEELKQVLIVRPVLSPVRNVHGDPLPSFSRPLQSGSPSAGQPAGRLLLRASPWVARANNRDQAPDSTPGAAKLGWFWRVRAY